MLRAKNKIIIACIALQLFGGMLVASAQADSLRNIETTIQGVYTFTVSEAKKLEYNPEIDPPKLNPPTLTYSVEDKGYATKPEIIPSKPQGYNTKESERIYGNYTRIGYGNYNTPLFETYFHNTRSKNLDYGIRYNFLSSEYLKANQVFSDHLLKGHLAYNLSSLSKVTVHAGYERNRINWFGFNSDSVKVDLESTKNIYNNFSIGSDFEKKGRTINDFSYGGGIEYYYQKDQYRNKENYLEVKGVAKKMVHQHLLSIPLSIDYTSFGKDTTYNRFSFNLNPRYLLDYGKTTLDIGFNSLLFHDSLGGELFWYPYADFKIKIIESKLNAHLGIDGGEKQNTYASFIKQNPFLDTVLELKNTINKVKVVGGLWGSINSKIAFGVEADFGNYLEMPFYLCDTTVLKKYQVVYDNIDIFNVKATLQLQWAEKFKSTLEFTYHNYQPGDQLYYWNMPSLEGKLNLQYNYNNKFTARVTTYYLGERFGKNVEFKDSTKIYLNSESVKLPGLVDVNVILEYRYNKMISVFLNGSNLTNQAYRRWLNYPGYKLSVLGGVAFTF